MNRLIVIFSFIVIFAFSCETSAAKGNLSFQPNLNYQNLVIQNVNIIPMNENKILENQSLYISNGKIEQIGDFSELNYAEDSIIIDGTGQYLLPGFSDMHVHFNSNNQLKEETYLYLANGVTLIRNMSGKPLHLEIKKEINERKLFGPEIFSTGPVIYGLNVESLSDMGMEEEAMLQYLGDMVHSTYNKGFDAVKVHDGLDLVVFNEILRVANELNIPVAGHVRPEVGLRNAIEAGIFSIEHFFGYNVVADLGNDEIIDLTVSSGVWNCPTLVMIQNYNSIEGAKERTQERDYFKYFSRDLTNSWNNMTSYPNNNLQGNLDLAEILNRSGANIVAGTDTSNYIPYTLAGFSLHDELYLLSEAGLEPYEVLKTTTINAARMLGEQERLGTVEIGKDADLVLLSANPLEDINNTRSINGVITKGRWISGDQIDQMLNEVQDSYTNR